MHFTQTAGATALGLKTVTWLAHALDNRGEPHALEALRQSLYNRARSSPEEAERYHAGYLALRARIGRSARRFPPSPIALRQRFERENALLSVNPVVDIYNLVSLATGLSIGAHDLATIEGDVRLDTTTGDETFHPLGSEAISKVPAGEYAYLDSGNRVLCRMEYRQSAYSCITRDSRDCLFIVQGHSQTPLAQLRDTARLVNDLLQTHCSAQPGQHWETP